MDEIVIDEKKYISSKKAAKLTGYAKDYVGQLCREGRVPARLVGRSWYVLESAIEDHRFNNAQIDTEEKKSAHTVVEATSKLESTWQFPRYESSSADILPSVNRLRASEDELKPHEVLEEVEQPMENSWKKWFERFDHVVGSEVQTGAHTEQEVPLGVGDEETEVSVPIRAIYEHKQEYKAPEKAYTYTTEVQREEAAADFVKIESVLSPSVKFLSVAIVAASLVLVGLNSGFLDKHYRWLSRVSFVSGITVYNK